MKFYRSKIALIVMLISISFSPAAIPEDYGILGGLVHGVLSILDSTIAPIKSVGEQVVGGIYDGLGNAYGAVQPYMGAAAEGIAGGINGIYEFGRGGMNTLWDGYLYPAGNNLVNSVSNEGRGLGEGLGDWWEESDLKKLFSGEGGDIGN